MKKIYIKYHDDELVHCEKIKKGEWVDLRAAERVELKAGEYRTISLGISVRVPRNYESHIVPRSSTFKKWGILQVNPHSVIDNSFSGNGDVWMYPVLATKDTVIEKNDRICQFRIVKSMGKVRFITRDNMGDNNRGGFGSTGVT